MIHRDVHLANGDIMKNIKTYAIERANSSWRIHRNWKRQPDSSDYFEIDPLAYASFSLHWNDQMQELKNAHDAFVAHAHAFDASLLTNPRFEDLVVLHVLGALKSRLGALGQSTRLFRDASDFTWEERKTPTKAVGDNYEAFAAAKEIRAQVLEAVEGVYRPESLHLTVGPIARVEEVREEPFTAVLVTAESILTKPVTLAIYAERL